MMKKAALHSLGCKVNTYETEAMRQQLQAAGYEIVPFAEKADVYVINTCSVTNIADHKSRQMIHRARKRNPQAVIVAAGCYVQAAPEILAEEADVDIIIGNNRKHSLTAMLEQYFAGDGEKGQTISDVINIGEALEYESMSVGDLDGHTRAFVKVQDGCNQFCSYCIIPYTRGRVRSRRPGEVLEEVRMLADRGYQEVVLTGIHLSSYGADFPEGERADLLDLIRRIHPVKGLRRIRLGSLEPRIITEEFAGALADMDKLCPHFHLSLQSGCDETLRRMNRHYTTEEYARRCEILRSCFDHPAVTTDVIVGFPGESEEEFADTRVFLEQMRFYEMHVFKYSRRAGTRADRMPGQIPEQVKAGRSEILLKLGKEMSADFRRGCLGKRLEVLLEEKAFVKGKDYMTGYTREYVRAAVPYEQGLKGKAVSGAAETLQDDEILLFREYGG